jgi:hypothetical protein
MNREEPLKWLGSPSWKNAPTNDPASGSRPRSLIRTLFMGVCSLCVP